MNTVSGLPGAHKVTPLPGSESLIVIIIVTKRSENGSHDLH
jgi:hypothetical protein